MSPIDLSCGMRTCLTCGTEIPDSRRKDARYCQKPACRARDFRRRKRKVEAERPRPPSPSSAERVVVTCSCGNRLLVQVIHLGPEEPASPTSPQEPPAEEVTRTVANGMGEVQAPASTTAATSGAVAENGSRSVSPIDAPNKAGDTGTAQAIQLSSLMPGPTAAIAPMVGAAQPLAVEVHRVRWTCELFGVVGGSRVIPLEQALVRHRDGRVQLLPGVMLAMGRTRHDGHGLSGSPGAWHHFYPDTGPSAFGLDADLAIMSWEPQSRRAVPVPAAVVEQLVGEDWRERLRAGLNDR